MPLAAGTAANAKTFPSRASEYGPGFRSVLAYGQHVTPASLAAAAKIRAEFSASLDQMLDAVDCMVCPSMSNSARVKDADPFAEATDAAWSSLVRNDVHTKSFNFSRHCRYRAAFPGTACRSACNSLAGG